MPMRSRLTLTVAALAVPVLLAGCANAQPGTGAETPAESGDRVIRVAATVTPMTDAVEAAAEVIGDGYSIELVPVSDYVQPNILLHNGEIDANLVQFVPFMEEFNDKNGADLVGVAPVYETVVSFYARELDSMQDIADGGTVVVPNDKWNRGRALQLLDDEGLITLDPAAPAYQATLDDIAENPRNLQITEVELLQLNTAYEEADLVFNMPSFARQLGLTPEADGLVTEQEPQFALTLVARSDNADSPEIEALAEALRSESVRQRLAELGVPAAD